MVDPINNLLDDFESLLVSVEGGFYVKKKVKELDESIDKLDLLLDELLSNIKEQAMADNKQENKATILSKIKKIIEKDEAVDDDITPKEAFVAVNSDMFEDLLNVLSGEGAINAPPALVATDGSKGCEKKDSKEKPSYSLPSTSRGENKAFKQNTEVIKPADDQIDLFKPLTRPDNQTLRADPDLTQNNKDSSFASQYSADDKRTLKTLNTHKFPTENHTAKKPENESVTRVSSLDIHQKAGISSKINPVIEGSNHNRRGVKLNQSEKLPPNIDVKPVGLRPESAADASQKISDKDCTSQKKLLIGIDLGTSKCSVISSRGDKFSFESVVGYAKDIIGKRLLGAEYLVGDEVLTNSYLDRKYPLKEGVISEKDRLYDGDAGKLIKHAVDLVKPAPDERICAVIGVPSNASKFNKIHLIQLAQLHLDVAMVVSEPFMVAYGLGELVDSIVVDIGAGTTDICAMKGSFPEVNDEFSLTKAGNYIDSLLMAAIENNYPGVELSPKFVRDLKEMYAFVGNSGLPIMVKLRKRGVLINADISREMRYACESVVADLVECIGKLISSFGVNHQPLAISNIILSGGGSKIKGLDLMLKNALAEYGNIQVKRVEDDVYCGSAGALMLACELPTKYWCEFDTVFEYEN